MSTSIPGTDSPLHWLLRYFPILHWLPHYQLSWLRADIIAGLTVWAVMVPEAMAYAGIAGLPALTMPKFTLEQLQLLIPGALAIVLLGYAETLGAAKAASTKSGGSVDPNQELVSHGPANIGSAFSGGFVVVGSLSKTSVSMGAGGKTQMASLVNAAFVILTLMFLLPLFTNLPHAALAAIAFLIWNIAVGLMNNVLKPILLSRGVQAPMAVIFVGAIGGLLAHGIIGLFVGAVVFVLGYTLFAAWLDDTRITKQAAE